MRGKFRHRFWMCWSIYLSVNGWRYRKEKVTSDIKPSNCLRKPVAPRTCLGRTSYVRKSHRLQRCRNQRSMRKMAELGFEKKIVRRMVKVVSGHSSVKLKSIDSVNASNEQKLTRSGAMLQRLGAHGIDNLLFFEEIDHGMGNLFFTFKAPGIIKIIYICEQLFLMFRKYQKQGHQWRRGKNLRRGKTSPRFCPMSQNLCK